MVYKYETEEHAILAAKEWASKMAKEDDRGYIDVQVVLSKGTYYVESPPEPFIRSWEKVIFYLEVFLGNVREKRYK